MPSPAVGPACRATLFAVALALSGLALLTVPAAPSASESARGPFQLTPETAAGALPPVILARLTGQGLDAFVDGFPAAPGQQFPPEAALSGPIGSPGWPGGDGGPGWGPVPPPARWVHSMIYDPIRDRLVVFGGQSYAGNSNEVWVLYLGGIPRWQRLSPSGTPPSARAFHTAVYDSLSDRMIVFGGDDGTVRNDVWQLTFAGNPTWSPLAVGGTAPPARAWHSAVHDRLRNRMLIYGGANGGTRYGDVWALSLGASPAWSELAAGGTAPIRQAAAVAYDPVDDRLLVFGGLDGAGVPRNDVHALTLAPVTAWSALAPTGTPPSARFGSRALYDRTRRRLVIFAGGTGAPNSNETWILSLGGTPAWSLLTPPAPPQGRQFHAVAHDPLGDRLLVFGGSSGPILSDTWALSLSPSEAWTPLSGTRRKGHSAVFDPARGRMVVFAGENGTQLNDLWELSLSDPETWARLNPSATAPSPRALHSAIFDPRRDRMVVFGGRGGPPVNDLWELTFSGTLGWRAIQPSGPLPAPRFDHIAVYDPVRYRMLLFGGVDTNGAFNDVWALALGGTPTWTQLVTSGTAPAGRGGAQAIYDPLRDRLVVFGGYNRNFIAQNDSWALSLSGTPTWSSLGPAGTPPAPRFAAATVYDPQRDRMIVSSGTDFAFFHSDTWALTLGSSPPIWAQQSFPGPAPSARSDHKAVYDAAADRLLLFGGINPLGVLHDAWELEFASTVGVDAPPAAAARLTLEAVQPNPSAHGSRLAFRLAAEGGVDAAVYDVAGRRVRVLLQAQLAAGRHVLVWDGREESGRRAPAGVYWVRVLSASESASGKVVRLP